MLAEQMKDKVPTKELQLFLIIAQYECINHIILEDFNEKIKVLSHVADFSEILKKFRFMINGYSIGLKYAVASLEQENKIVKNQQEIMLSMPVKEREILEMSISNEMRLQYLLLAQVYREMALPLGFKKIKTL